MVDLGLSGWVWALGLRPFETERMMLVRWVWAVFH